MMTDDEIALARADIEATADLPSREPIVITWEEWRSSRAAKRETLEKLGLSAPSRRTSAIGSQEKRLRKAFGDARVPMLKD